MNNFSYKVDDEGIATIAWNTPGKRMNVMSWSGFTELDELVSGAISDHAVCGILITSAKKDFAGGMDLGLLADMFETEREDRLANAYRDIIRIHGILRRIELAGRKDEQDQSKPVVAALNGTTMGAGYEIALACHHIICTDRPEARIGLPEIRVGLFPGAGGTTRLVRRLGLAAASPYLFKGVTPSPQKALAARLVDQITSPDELVPAAREWLKKAQSGDTVKPWDKPGYRPPGGAPYSKQGFATFTGASAMINGQTQGVYPAARAMQSAIYEGLQLPFDAALRTEARCFAELLANPSPAAMIRTNFVHRQELCKGARRPQGIPVSHFGRLGMIGAGMMGSGIALVAALGGIEVQLCDLSLARAKKGKQTIGRILDGEVRRKRLDADQAQNALKRIACATLPSGFSSCQLIIEAVFENPEVKERVFSQLCQTVDDEAIIASNTSTLPITSLADSVRLPERFVGIHFFSPVHRMSLVEIIRGEQTSNAAVGVAFDFARQINKIPIIVNDGRNFYANRCIIPYINEGVRMVGEGVSPALVENSARQIGMPVGPLQLVDETSIELAVHIAEATREALGDDYDAEEADKVIFRLFDLGRLGRKSGAGFYEYNDRKKRLGLWPGLSREFNPSNPQPDAQEVRDRLLLIQVTEAIQSLEDGVLEDVREGDIGAVFGWGFAPWSGGPFQWIDGKGATRVHRMCQQLATRHGRRFESPRLLVEYAECQRLFHDRKAATQ